MSRPVYTESFLLRSTARCPVGRSNYRCSSEPDDISLVSTVLLVFLLAVGGAFFIMAMAYLLGEDHSTVLHPPVADGTHALLWAVKQSTRGCAAMC